MINESIIISDHISLIDVLNIMDRTRRKLLIVCEGKRFLGVISIGDIQRALLNKMDLSLPVSQCQRKIITYATVHDNPDKVKEKMLAEKIESMPIVDEDSNLCDVIEWEQLFSNDDSTVKQPLDLPVVIMAGGKGTRLLPLTNLIPKPLIPISNKTIIEEIMERFRKYGCSRFYVSVNYMMDTIKDYFKRRPEWNISYIEEKKPLGTGGSLYILKETISETFFVTNCDTLVDIELRDLVDYHKKNCNLITVVTAVKSIHIPYGTLDTEKDGIVNMMKEKPDFVFQINTGFYVFEPDVLRYIEDDRLLDLPDLINRLIHEGKKIGAFPVSEGSWTDMGNWEEYLRLVEKQSSQYTPEAD